MSKYLDEGRKSPEIPKLEEPGMYIWREENKENHPGPSLIQVPKVHLVALHTRKTSVDGYDKDIEIESVTKNMQILGPGMRRGQPQKRRGRPRKRRGPPRKAHVFSGGDGTENVVKIETKGCIRNLRPRKNLLPNDSDSTIKNVTRGELKGSKIKMPEKYHPMVLRLIYPQ